LQYFVGRQRETASTTFTVFQNQYNQLQDENVEGELRFTVSSVDTDRGLTVSLGNQTFEFGRVQPQTYTRRFDAATVTSGNNTVSFTTTGSYTVEDVHLALVETEPGTTR
jgi:hypothetical protein